MLTIVFDLDGTLIDTAPDLIDTLNLILAREGLPSMPFEAARRLIGGGSRGMLERALISPTARCRSRSSRQRSTGCLPAATVWRCAPTSSNGCRGCC
jgi:phosphoglycolate phosphatase-like HAD superfamily hydrolase